MANDRVHFPMRDEGLFLTHKDLNIKYFWRPFATFAQATTLWRLPATAGCPARP
jgi:hypothetical protein